jgi:hypothetical protein
VNIAALKLLLHPECVKGLIVQNGNAYDEGLLKFWDPIKKYWSTRRRRIVRHLNSSSNLKQQNGNTRTVWAS